MAELFVSKHWVPWSTHGRQAASTSCVINSAGAVILPLYTSAALFRGRQTPVGQLPKAATDDSVPPNKHKWSTLKNDPMFRRQHCSGVSPRAQQWD